jgi:hypothetical protein
LRTQQLSWLEITATPTCGEVQDQNRSAERALVSRPCHAQLKSARVELPGATWFERFLASHRNPHSATAKSVAAWPQGPDWPDEHRHLTRRRLKKAARMAAKRAANCRGGARA